MKRMSSGVRYRPYRRSVSLHCTEPEVIEFDDTDLDDTIVVLYDGVRQQAAAAAAAVKAATTAPGKPATATAAVKAATAGTSGVSDAPQKTAASAAAGGSAFRSTLEHSPWRVSRIPLPFDSDMDISTTVCASPADAAAGAKANLTIDDVFSPFAASPVLKPDTGTATVKKRPKGTRFPMTSTPAVPDARPTTSTPATRRHASGSDIEDVTPFVITLEEDASVVEVTEVRRIIRHRTPATVKKKSAAKKTPVSNRKSAAAKKKSAAAGETPVIVADLSSSLEEGELTRSLHKPHRSRLLRSASRGRPMRRTSSTQRRLQAVVRAARNTLTRQSPGARTPARGAPARSRGKKMKRAGAPRGKKAKPQPEPLHWTVDRRGSRFAAPLGATSDQPIQFAPDFSESFARMVAERPRRPIIIDGPNVAYAHGRDQVCSIRGITITLNYFKNLGHRCTVFLPSSFINRARTEENVKLLEEIYLSGDLAYTPSRRIRGRVVTSYDDRYVVMYATRVGGVILSRDLYRDVADERPDWKDTIDNRLLIPVFVGDQLLLPPDPLGRHGPGLLEFLTFPEGTSLLPDEEATRDGHGRGKDRDDRDRGKDRDDRNDRGKDRDGHDRGKDRDGRKDLDDRDRGRDRDDRNDDDVRQVRLAD